MRVTPVFFDPLDDQSFRAREHTRGPWHPDYQHGGPPAGLLGRAIERLLPADFLVARMTLVFTRPVPIATLRVTAAVTRDGRTVKEATASLTTAEALLVARADALAIRTAKVDLPAALPPAATPPPGRPETSAQFRFPFFASSVGYHTAMDIRFVSGSFGHGPVQAWMRMLGALVAGEDPSPLQRVLCAADSGNGVSVVLPVDRYTFVNPDLTVALIRPLNGSWVCLDAGTTPAGTGIGLADARLWDEVGLLGRAVQTLVVAPR